MKIKLYVSVMAFLSVAIAVVAETEPSKEKAIKAVEAYVECLRSGAKYEDGSICGAYFPSYEYIELSKTCLLREPIAYYSDLTIVYRCEGGIVLSANVSRSETDIRIEGVYQVVP